MEKVKRKTIDFTEGSIWKKMVLFALPLLVTSFIQQLYNTVDLIFVGNFLGKEASAAVGASSLIITCLVGFFTGMSVGAGVVIAQTFGSKDENRLSKAVHTAIALGFAGGIILMIIGYIFAPTFLRWMNTPKEILISAVSYIRIYFLSLISVVTYNMGAGVLRAVGNSKIPLKIQFVGGLTNVFMDAVFVMVFKDGVAGVAWATLFSQTVSAVLVLVYLMKSEENYKISLNKLKIDREIFLNIINVGIPAGLQSLVITLSNVFAQYNINSLGVNSIAAFTAYFKVELIIYMPIVAFGQANMTFSGQNMGAGNVERMKQGTKVCIIIGAAVALTLSMLTLLFGRQAFGLFTTDDAVIDLGIRIANTTFPFYFLYVFLEVLGSAIRGAGKATPPMIIILVNICIVRTILLFSIMSVYHDVRGVAVTYPITWFLTSLCMLVYFVRGKWYKKDIIEQVEEMV